LKNPHDDGGDRKEREGQEGDLAMMVDFDGDNEGKAVRRNCWIRKRW
jgi:hypothetical protein